MNMNDPQAETRFPMLRGIIKWGLIPTLLLTLLWTLPMPTRHPIPLDYVVCAGAIMLVLASFIAKQRIADHYVTENG